MDFARKTRLACPRMEKTLRPFRRIGCTALMAALALPPAAGAHEFAASRFVSEPRTGRFPYLGTITYRCDRGQRQVICSGQGVLVSRCLVLTSDHLARDAVDRRTRADGLTKSFVLDGTAYDVVPLEAGTDAGDAPMAENAEADWALMQVRANACPGSHQRWLRAPTIDPARLPTGTALAVYSEDERDVSRLVVSRGRFEGRAPGDVLMMASASMRPGQSGGLVTALAPDGSPQVIGIVQGANYPRNRFFQTGLKRFSPQTANLFTDIFAIYAQSRAGALIVRDQN